MAEELRVETDVGKIIFGIEQTQQDLYSNTMTVYATTQIPRSRLLDDPELPEKVRAELLEILSGATNILSPKE